MSLSNLTIEGWENDRFASEAAAEIDALPVAIPTRPVAYFTQDDRPELVALKGRVTSGLGVQLLAEPVEDGRAFITLDVAGRTETFEVPSEHALDAFDHPYAYGGTLPIR